MTAQPDIHNDFAAWTAHHWALIAPGTDSTAASVAIRFKQIADQLANSHARTIKPFHAEGVRSIEDFRILGLLRHIGDPGIQTQHIADHLKFDPSTVSARTTRLHQHDLIQRVDNPTDRRTHYLKLNPTKTGLVDTIYQALVTNHEDFFNNLTQDQHHQLADLLSRI